MARRRVTYLEVADERPGRRGAGVAVLDLGPQRPVPSAGHVVRPHRDLPACPAWFAQLALVALLAAGAVLDLATTGPDERAAIERQRERRPAVVTPSTQPVAARSAPVVVDTASIVGAPWGGVFEHHPDARGEDPVPLVHAITFAGPGGRGLLVVDATRRAFGGPEHPVDRDRSPRLLGSGTGSGLATLQWDAGGYGLSLTTVGLSPGARRAVAGAVRLPDGPSLQHGRPPALDGAVLHDHGLALTGAASGAASSFGSPLIGQGGGASIEGQLHRDRDATLLVSVVEDQLVGAALVRRALGPTVAIDASGLPGVTAVAALDHGPAPTTDRRIRGWSRLVLDHDGGVTIELSSDVLRPAELLEAARAMALDRLVRTTAPLGGASGSGGR